MPSPSQEGPGQPLHGSPAGLRRTWKDLERGGAHASPEESRGDGAARRASPTVSAFEIGFLAGTRYLALLNDGLQSRDAVWVAVGDAISLLADEGGPGRDDPPVPPEVETDGRGGAARE
jgi:hypothetical protein